MLIKVVPPGYIIKKIKKELLFIIGVGIIIHYLTARYSTRIPEMPLSVPTFLGTAISILLSFKMSQSYDRWWEARKIWGSIVNDSRSLVLQLQALLPLTPVDLIKKMCYRQIAWCYALGKALRGQDPTIDLDHYLDEVDFQRVKVHHNKPLAILKLNAEELKTMRQEGQLDTITHVQLDNTLVRLCDAMGKAERINTTVFPVTYRMFLHYSIYLFVIVLSIALKNVPAVFEIPLLVLISSVFFLLEKTAFHLQDPFRNRPSDIPVTAIAQTIEVNIRQLLGEQDVVKPSPPQGFYVL